MTAAPVAHGRKLAWVPDRLVLSEVPDYLRADRLLAAEPVPAVSANGDLVLDVLNQGGLGSCVGNGTNQAARAEMIRTGAKTPPLGSRLWTYYLARAYDHETAYDYGTQIHHAFAALARYGLPPEEIWPYSDDDAPGALFSRMPSPDAWRAAFDAKLGLRAHRIMSAGRSRVDDVKRALGQRRLVVFGTAVSYEFCSGAFDPAVPLPPPVDLPIAGGHCMAVVDHVGDSFRVVNSWSEDWGNGGFWQMSADYLSWVETNDLWVFDSIPKFPEGKPS